MIMPRTETLLWDNWEFSLDSSKPKTVHLPHDWAIDAPFNRNMEDGCSQGFRDRRGIGLYKRSLYISKLRSGYKYYLHFGGVFECSTVLINGKEAGGHKYGYSPFQVDITELVHQGDNTIEIRVDNTAMPADRWYSGGGIYRLVTFIEAWQLHFDRNEVIVTANPPDSSASEYWTVRVDTGLTHPVKGILSHLTDNINAEGEDGKLLFTVKNPRLWSAETPHLYSLTLSLKDGSQEGDEISLKIGLRDIVMDPEKGMLVNGERVILKGVCVHQEVGCRGIAAKKEIWRQRLEVLKEMGCNCIRGAHHVHSAEFLDLCDEMGFYVYEEPFDKWTGGLYGRYFQTEWKKDIDAMIKRDRNRPCIFIWGVGNEVENQGQESMLKILGELIDYVKTLDSSRPVTYAMNPHFKRRSNIDITKVKDIQKFVDEADEQEITDPYERVERISLIGDMVDVISCNYQEQWYELIHEKCPNKPILGSEVYQYFMGHMEQMQNLTEKLPVVAPKEHSYVIGSIIWSGYDYLGESMGWPSKGWSGAPIRTNMEKRPSFYMLKSHWSDTPMVHFSVMDYSLRDEVVKAHWEMPVYADHWHFPQLYQTVIPYMITSNCQEVRLFHNSKRFYIQKPSDFPNGIITGFLPWAAGTVTAEGYNDGVLVCRHELVTPGAATQLAFDCKTIIAPAEPERSAEPAEPGYEILLTVRAFDKDNNPCFRESCEVRFVIEGQVEILAVDNGCLMNNEPYSNDCVHMYHGAASVQIRIAGVPGRVKVSAWADGLHSGDAFILVE